MAGDSDIQANISCNLDEFTAPLSGAIDQMNQMTTVVHLQETSWTTLGVSVLSAVANITGPVLSLYSSYKKMQAATLAMAAANATATPPTLTLGAAVNFLLSPIVLTLAAVTLLAGAIYYFSGAAGEAADNLTKTSAAAEDAGDSLSGLQQIQESFMAGFVGTEGLEALDAFGDAGDELSDAFSELGDALLQPLIDAGFEIGSLGNLFGGFASTVRMVTDVVNVLTTGVESVTSAVKDGVAQLTLWATMAATGMSADDAGAMIAAREAERAASIEAFQAMKAETFAAETLKSLMESATDEATKRGELSRIASITSLEALDEETEALERQIATLKQKGKFDKDAQKDAEARANAIANQRADIESGKVKPKESAIDEMLRKAREDVAALKFGKGESQVIGFELGGEDPAKIAALREQLTLIDQLKKAEQDREKAERKAEQEAQKKIDREVQAAMSTAKLRDEIDVLTGAMTKQQAREAELIRDGMTARQAEEIAALEAEKEKLSEKKKPGKTDMKAALSGSSEAASILVRGIGGGRTMEQIANKQLTIQQQMLLALKENKPQELQPLTLGA